MMVNPKPTDLFLPTVRENRTTDKEDKILIYITEEVEVIPLGDPGNPVVGIAKLLLYASLA